MRGFYSTKIKKKKNIGKKKTPADGRDFFLLQSLNIDLD